MPRLWVFIPQETHKLMGTRGSCTKLRIGKGIINTIKSQVFSEPVTRGLREVKIPLAQFEEGSATRGNSIARVDDIILRRFNGSP